MAQRVRPEIIDMFTEARDKIQKVGIFADDNALAVAASNLCVAQLLWDVGLEIATVATILKNTALYLH